MRKRVIFTFVNGATDSFVMDDEEAEKIISNAVDGEQFRFFRMTSRETGSLYVINLDNVTYIEKRDA